jgi:hypothetical protein
MAFEFSNYSVKHTFVAGENLSAKQYHFVKIDNGDGEVVAVSGATDRPIGVLQNTPTAGQAAEVLIVGGTKVECGGSASYGQPLFASASATAVTLAFGSTASAAYSVGTFIENATAGTVAAAVIDCANAARGL